MGGVAADPMVVALRDLERAIKGAMPLLGVAARGASLKEPLYVTVEELAARYRASRSEVEEGLKRLGVGPGRSGKRRRFPVGRLGELDGVMQGIVEG